VRINNGLAEQHPIVICELVRPITTDINALLTATPQQRLEIHDLALASENEYLQHEHS
jgi:hypothetical protein